MASCDQAFVQPPRGVRRSAVTFIVVVLVAAGGASAAIYQERLLDLWSAARSAAPDLWSAARSAAPLVWAEGKRLAENGWKEIRSQLPIDEPKAEVVAPPKPARMVAARQRVKGGVKR